jgi:hypothetical protein
MWKVHVRVTHSNECWHAVSTLHIGPLLDKNKLHKNFNAHWREIGWNRYWLEHSLWKSLSQCLSLKEPSLLCYQKRTSVHEWEHFCGSDKESTHKNRDDLWYLWVLCRICWPVALWIVLWVLTCVEKIDMGSVCPFHWTDWMIFGRLTNNLPVVYVRLVHLTLSLRGPRLPHRVYLYVALWAFKPSPDILVTSS